MLVFKTQQRFQTATSKRVLQHAPAVAQYEGRIVEKRRRKVTQLHPTLRAPPHELNLQGRHFPSTHDSRGSIVLLEAITHDQVSLVKITRHRGARIRCWMLDVRPVDKPPGKFEVTPDGLSGVIGVSDNQSADNKHPVSMKVLNRLERGVADDLSVLTLLVFGSCAKEGQSRIQDVFDPEKHITKAGRAHQRRQCLAV